MNFSAFSPKQKLTLQWWCPNSPYSSKDAVFCHGAVRSGKTLCMALSFFCWAMACFHHAQFGICATTFAAVERNILSSVLPALKDFGFSVSYQKSSHQLQVSFGSSQNSFFLYGGRNEGSASLIQGITLAGVLLDEAALMPRSFVEQACARCSVPGAKLWFNCNPEGPTHWLYQEWLLKADEKNLLPIHFTMYDNPSLDDRTRSRYERMFRGTFYRRFVLGEWVAADGLVYDFFPQCQNPPPPQGPFEAWRISCDYGTVNPASFGLWGKIGSQWFRVQEYYYDSRAEGRQKTDREYVRDLLALKGSRDLELVVVDPSAASFIEALRRENLPVQKADNQVLSGIRVTADALRSGQIVICQGCDASLREFSLYRWDAKAVGDRVLKEHDHAMDDIRYFAMSLQTPDQPPPSSAALCIERKAF